MLTLRNLHRSFEQKSQKKQLTVDGISKVYSLDGLNRFPHQNDQKHFLLLMEGCERFAMKQMGTDFTALRHCINWNTAGEKMKQSEKHMSYASFVKRYNGYQLKPKPKNIKHQNGQTLKPKINGKIVKIKFPSLKTAVVPALTFIRKGETYKCMFCGKLQSTSTLLQKHQTKCQQRALKLRRKAMLQKVRSIIVKSKRPVKKKTLPIPIKKKPIKVLPFKCDKCTDCFVSLQTLEMHLKYDHRPRPTCSICNKIFDSRRKLLEHENLCNGEDKLFIKQSLGVVDILCSNKVRTCNKCENLFTSADHLREHKLLVNKRNAIPIEITKEEVTTEKIFFKVCVKNVAEVSHKPVKLPKGENNCTHCGKEFQNENRLLQHGVFCHVKNGVRRTRHAIKRNGKELQSKQATSCKLCGINLKTINKLKKHNLLFHPGASKSGKQKDISCATCRKTFASPQHYQKHFKHHGSPKICPLCSIFKHFENMDFLQWHIRLFHRKKFCAVCQRTYGVDATHKCRSLRSKRKGKSQRLNVEEEPPDPNMELVQAPHIVRYRKTPYVDGSFACHKCAETFSREIYLMEHLITHTNKSPFACKQCNVKFSDLSVFTSHIQSNHRKQPSPFNLLSLKNHLRKELDLKYCPHCSDIFLGTEVVNEHCQKQHNKLMGGSVLFTTESDVETFISVDKDIPLTDSNIIVVDNLNTTPIKSAGLPLERVLTHDNCCTSTQEKSSNESDYLSQEEAEKSLILPLSMLCDEEAAQEEECVDKVDVLLDEESPAVPTIRIEDVGVMEQEKTAKKVAEVKEKKREKRRYRKRKEKHNGEFIPSQVDVYRENEIDTNLNHSQARRNMIKTKIKKGIQARKKRIEAEKDETVGINKIDAEMNCSEPNNRIVDKQSNRFEKKTGLTFVDAIRDIKDARFGVNGDFLAYPFRCDPCDINFLDQRMLNNHNEYVHQILLDPQGKESKSTTDETLQNSHDEYVKQKPFDPRSKKSKVTIFQEKLQNNCVENENKNLLEPDAKKSKAATLDEKLQTHPTESAPQVIVEPRAKKSKVSYLDEKLRKLKTTTERKSPPITLERYMSKSSLQFIDLGKELFAAITPPNLKNHKKEILNHRKRKQQHPRCLKSVDKVTNNDTQRISPKEKKNMTRNNNNNNTNHTPPLKENKKKGELNRNGYRIEQSTPPLARVRQTRFEDELFLPLPQQPLPVNPAYFTAPKWDERNAFDVWDMR